MKKLPVTLAILLLLSACGQAGPLVLPDAPQPPAPQQPTPAQQDSAPEAAKEKQEP